MRRALQVGLSLAAFTCLFLATSEKVSKHSKSEESVLTPVAIAPAPEAPIALKIEPPKTQVQTVKIRAGDTLSKIFTRLGINTKDIKEILLASPSAKRLAYLQPGQSLDIHIKEAEVSSLVLNIGPGNTLKISRAEKSFKAELQTAPMEKQLAFGKGSIHTTLFSSVKKAGLDQSILKQMIDIFGKKIDFALDLQPNDSFRVLYEEKYVNGEKIQTGNILAAEIIADGKKHQAVRYTDKAGRTAYFSPEGQGLHQAFLRTPVNFARVSSHFGMRHHPLLRKMHQHKGVDYSAPKGTPVLATGDGKVIFAGIKGGYGKVIELQHGARYTTLYAHLSRFSKELRPGAIVKQGQTIGFVGATGRATGAHLHYEFKIDGVHRNPLTVALPKKGPIQEASKGHFISHAKEMIRLLDTHERKTHSVASYGKKQEPAKPL